MMHKMADEHLKVTLHLLLCVHHHQLKQQTNKPIRKGKNQAITQSINKSVNQSTKPKHGYGLSSFEQFISHGSEHSGKVWKMLKFSIFLEKSGKVWKVLDFALL